MDSKYIKEYEKLVKKIIDKSFPTLKNEKIEICQEKVKWRGKAEFWPWKKRITVSTKTKRYRKEKIIGLFTHELCHCETAKKRGFLWLAAIWQIMKYSKKLVSKIEWETDMLAIQKGYGRYLLYSKKNQTQRQKAGYMSRETVRVLMKDYKDVKI